MIYTTAETVGRFGRSGPRVITPTDEATVIDVDDLVGWTDVWRWRNSLPSYLRVLVLAAGVSAGGKGIHALAPPGVSAARTREFSGDPLFRRLSIERGFFAEFALASAPTIFFRDAVAMAWWACHRQLLAARP